MPGETSIVDQVDPAEAYRTLESDSGAILIDVRTRAEWAFVGVPDLTGLGRAVLPVEWAVFPSMQVNPGFVDEVSGRIEGPPAGRMFFICRSGSRSMSAARTVAAAYDRQGVAVHCTNVAEGFEGDLDQDGHRGRVNGWKFRGLPWRQN